MVPTQTLLSRVARPLTQVSAGGAAICGILDGSSGLVCRGYWTRNSIPNPVRNDPGDDEFFFESGAAAGTVLQVPQGIIPLGARRLPAAYVSTGPGMACAVDVNATAYCWGFVPWQVAANGGFQGAAQSLVTPDGSQQGLDLDRAMAASIIMQGASSPLWEWSEVDADALHGDAVASNGSADEPVVSIHVGPSISSSSSSSSSSTAGIACAVLGVTGRIRCFGSGDLATRGVTSAPLALAELVPPEQAVAARLGLWDDGEVVDLSIGPKQACGIVRHNCSDRDIFLGCERAVVCFGSGATASSAEPQLAAAVRLEQGDPIGPSWAAVLNASRQAPAFDRSYPI